MIALLSSLFLAALVGSPHCAGMCGGFVAFYAGQGGGRRWTAHLAYNGGRLASYVALGLAAGAVGAGVERMGAAAGVTRAAAIVAGALMVAWGAAAILHALGVRLPARPAGAGRGPGFVASRFAAALRAVHAQPPAARALVVGLLSALLPCGFLYVFVAAAGSTGSPPHGAAIMAAFWAGTVPIMAGLGLAVQGALGPLARRLPVVTAAALLVLGLLTMAGRMQVPLVRALTPACCQQHAGH